MIATVIGVLRRFLPAFLRTRPALEKPQWRAVWDLLFTAANAALGKSLAHPRWLGARTHGHTAILHTWNRRLQFHPHLHCNSAGRTAPGGTRRAWKPSRAWSS